jgi:hypothetical protein
MSFLIAALVFSAVRLQAAETQVTVHLTSGRMLTGTLDSRTDKDRLWLRWQVGEVELQRPIAWERIASAQVESEAMEVQALKEQAARLATPGRQPQLRQASTNVPSTRNPTIPAVVHSIQCDAWLANWDADSLLDGLILEVVALDQFGNAIAAQGTVEADLMTIDYQPAYLNSSSGGRVPTSLGHWNQRWDSHERNRLELLGRDPQRDRNLDRYALLKVKISIPGSGVFEQQIDGLRTRPFTPVQNLLWR